MQLSSCLHPVFIAFYVRKLDENASVSCCAQKTSPSVLDVAEKGEGQEVTEGRVNDVN